jgi:hypothetical protein
MNSSATVPSPPRPQLARSRRAQPLERLEAEIVSLAGQLAAATARYLKVVGEFDAAEGAAAWGMRSTAHWLAWQTSLDLRTARDHVRVARALRDLPLTAAAFAEGRLSYAKVRALTRFANTSTEAELIELAKASTATQLDRVARTARRVSNDARAPYARARFTIRHDENGDLLGSFRLPAADGAQFVHALRLAADAGQATVAQALTMLATHYVDTRDVPTSGGRRVELMLHARVESGVDVGAVLDVGSLSPAATAKRLTCDCPTSTVTVGSDGEALHVGRRTRRIRERLRRAVHARDRGLCRVPGCAARATQIHHIRHWANGGDTCLRNLISLCDAHHWFVHEGGAAVVPRAPGRWALLTADGITVEPEPPVSDHHSGELADHHVPQGAVTGSWDGSRLTAAALDIILTNVAPASAPSMPRPRRGSAEPSVTAHSAVGETGSDYDEGETLDYSTIAVNVFTTA